MSTASDAMSKPKLMVEGVDADFKFGSSENKNDQKKAQNGSLESKSSKSGSTKEKTPAPRLKVVIRNLPPSLPKHVFINSIESFIGSVSYLRYDGGKALGMSTSRAVMAFKEPPSLLNFVKSYSNHEFRKAQPMTASSSSTSASKGVVIHRAIVDWAPFQKIPKERSKKDARINTIDKDSAFKSFCKSLGIEDGAFGKHTIKKREVMSISALGQSKVGENVDEKGNPIESSNYLNAYATPKRKGETNVKFSTPLLDYIRAKKRAPPHRGSSRRSAHGSSSHMHEHPKHGRAGTSSPKLTSRKARGRERERREDLPPAPSTPKILKRGETNDGRGPEKARKASFAPEVLTPDKRGDASVVPDKETGTSGRKGYGSPGKSIKRGVDRRARRKEREVAERAEMGEREKPYPREKGKEPLSKGNKEAPSASGSIASLNSTVSTEGGTIREEAKATGPNGRERPERVRGRGGPRGVYRGPSRSRGGRRGMASRGRGAGPAVPTGNTQG